MKTPGTIIALMLFALTSIAVSETAHAGAWIDKESITITRGAVVGGRYPIQICFKVQRSARDQGNPYVLSTNMRVLETDYWNQTISNGKINVQIPAPGARSALQCWNFTYPCSWGDTIWFEVSSRPGFVGATGSQSFFAFAPGEGSASVPAGELGLTPEVIGDPALYAFFTSEEEAPMIPVSRGFEGMGGDALLQFTTRDLLDPAALGYEGYALEVFDDGGPLMMLPIEAVDKEGDFEFMEDEEMFFGEPATQVVISETVLDLDLVTGAVILMIDIDDVLPPLPVYEGPVFTPPAEIMVRLGTVSSSGLPPHDILWINGDRGDEFRHLAATAGAPLSISMLDFPGAIAEVPYVLYVHGRENTDADLTAHPKGLGLGAFSTPLTGGRPITLLNTIGKENKLGSPKISGAPFGPGTLLELGSTPGSLAGRSLTFQAIVADELAPNGVASFSNAIVVDFD